MLRLSHVCVAASQGIKIYCSRLQKGLQHHCTLLENCFTSKTIRLGTDPFKSCRCLHGMCLG